jgi:aspartyl/asparaginyl beta-hydroxylase (cupin superfamily)
MNTPAADSSQIGNLVQHWERTLAAGRHKEAERLLGQLEATAPNHPLVLNARGVRELQQANYESARALLERAVAIEGGNAAIWINLASALRKLKLRQEEMAALERALSIEPRHLLALLQKASLFDLMDEPTKAARTYQHALQTIPAGAQLPESLRDPIGRAMQVIKEYNAQLEAFVQERLRETEARCSEQERSRFKHGLDALLGKRRIFTPQPTFFHLPKIPAEEFFRRSDFSWLPPIEAATEQIRAEFERVFAEDAAQLEPYVTRPDSAPLGAFKELNHSQRWSVYYLWRDGKSVEEHLARCPVTAALLAQAPRLDIPQIGPTAFFSVLDAHSRIPPHTGVTNTRLIVHIPLIVPAGCGFRVGSDTREWKPGEAFVFDDSMEHEAWNDSDTPRAVLIFDIWNPYLTEVERDLVRDAASAIREYHDESPLVENH